MTIAFGCVLIAGLLPFTCTVYAKLSKPGYDSRTPREFLDSLEGKGKRADWAQRNSFEAFPFFAAGVIIGYLRGASPNTIALLAVLFILFRIGYIISYISDRARLRMTFWALAFLTTISLFFI